MKSYIQNKIKGLLDLLQFDNGWQLIGQRIWQQLSAGRDTTMTFQIQGIQLKANWQEGDAIAIQECLISDTYTQLLTTLDLPESITCLDVGAHVGSFSLLLHRMGKRFTKLLAVEMNPATCERLRTNLQHNLGQQDVQVLQAALWSDNQTMTVKAGLGSTGDSLVRPPQKVSQRDDFTVNTFSLESLIEAYFADIKIDLLKMDIEGAEWEILYSPKLRGLQHCSNLIIEIHSRESSDSFSDLRELITHLQTLGFRLQAQYETPTTLIAALTQTPSTVT